MPSSFVHGCLKKNYEDMILVNPANLSIHLLSEFNGQSFPEQGCVSIAERDIDLPLAKELLSRWVIRFSDSAAEWKDKALFRSLNMANEAGRIPALAAGVFYDAGRSLALWLARTRFWRIRVAPANQISVLSPRCSKE
jgi:hypothetical protein